MISDGHPQLRHDHSARDATQMHRVGFLRDVSANIVDPFILLAAVALILFALTH